MTITLSNPILSAIDASNLLEGRVQSERRRTRLVKRDAQAALDNAEGVRASTTTNTEFESQLQSAMSYVEHGHKMTIR